MSIIDPGLNPLTAGDAYTGVFFISTLSTTLQILKIICDIIQQYLITVDPNFVKSE